MLVVILFVCISLLLALGGGPQMVLFDRAPRAAANVGPCCPGEPPARMTMMIMMIMIMMIMIMMIMIS